MKTRLSILLHCGAGMTTMLLGGLSALTTLHQIAMGRCLLITGALALTWAAAITFSGFKTWRAAPRLRAWPVTQSPTSEGDA